MRNEVSTLSYHFISVLKSSEKGNVQLVADDSGRLFVRRYREISPELFRRIQGVSSPYVERLTERSENESGSYIISEYIEGTPASDRTFTEKEAVRLLLELCSAVKALHKDGIIHRDIKPSNIICGKDGHIRLIDFDSARLEKSFQSRDTELLGTVGFAPPEQYGFTQTDNRSDIYSFGVTMREILGENADKRKYRRIIDRCTRFEPDKRYPDISAVRRAVSSVTRRDILPFAVGAVLLAAAAMFAFRSRPASAPPGIVRLSETCEVSSASEQSDTPETAYPTAESVPDITDSSNEVTQEQPVTPAPDTAEAESRSPQTADSTSPETLPQPPVLTEEPEPVIAEPEPVPTEEPLPVPEEAVSVPTEEPAPERTPNILSDSINPDKMTFETIQRDDGLFTDVFDYVFYDDPAVHGEWRLYGLLMPNKDFAALSAEDLVATGSMEDFVWQYLTVSPDGRCQLRDPQGRPFPNMLWTNGYYISSNGGCSFVERMFEITVGGVEYLMCEQKPTGNYRVEVPHRYLIYRRKN